MQDEKKRKEREEKELAARLKYAQKIEAERLRKEDADQLIRSLEQQEQELIQRLKKAQEKQQEVRESYTIHCRHNQLNNVYPYLDFDKCHLCIPLLLTLLCWLSCVTILLVVVVTGLCGAATNVRIMIIVGSSSIQLS